MASVYQCRLRVMVCVLLCGLWSAYGSERLNVSTVVSGLNQPAGLAFHPETSELTIAEKGANRIVAVRNGAIHPIVSTDFTVSEELPFWAINETQTRTWWLEPVLREPGRIAFAPDGRLFVMEEKIDGRLFEFTPDAQGVYTSAKVIPISWLKQRFTWVDMKCDAAGNLYVVGAVKDNRVLFFGSVLMRDTQGDWWVVDYGPFINFCGIGLSKDGDVLAVCNRNKGGLSWWDVGRHLDMGEMAEAVGKEYDASHLSVLADGAFAISADKKDGSGSEIVRINPNTGKKDILVSGFRSIGGMAMQNHATQLYFSDPAAGTLNQIELTQEWLSQVYLLEKLLDVHEVDRGFTPRDTPDFVRSFLLKSGVKLEKNADGEEGDAAETVDKPEADINWKDMGVTLKQFARSVPLAAGKVRAKPKEPMADPIVEIQFVVFFPGESIQRGDGATPSLSFFLSVRRSGKVEKTSKLFDGSVFSREKDEDMDDWMGKSAHASMTIPVGTANIRQEDSNKLIDLVFMGLGFYDDYYLSLVMGLDNTGELMVETVDGTVEHYDITFADIDDNGKERRNVILAGFDPVEEESDVDAVGWLNIGYSPVGTAVSSGDRKLKKFSSVDAAVSELIEQKNIKANKFEMPK